MTTMGGRTLFAPSAAASRSGGAVSVSSSRRRDGRHASGGRSVDTGRCNACFRRPTVATMDVRGEYERSSFDGDDVWSDEAKPGIGAEYGDTGFVDFRFSGDIRVDVEQLNERLEVKGADRIRHSGIAPDEAHGLIFTWDGVITDTRDLQRQAWVELAEEEGFKWPEIERPFIYESTPERAITEVLGWTRDFAYARRLGWRLNELYSNKFAEEMTPKQGVRQWLELAKGGGIPLAVVSNMSREAVTNAMEGMGLDIFDAMVTAEDDMDTHASQLLAAAIKLARPPRKCIAFTGSPEVVTAAHNCTMKAVGVVGSYKHYDLNHADLTCGSMSELSLINVRRLFALDGESFMDLKTQRADGYGNSSAQTRIGTFK